METALAASMTRATSSRSMVRFLLETAITPRELKPADVGAGQAHVGGADLDPRHELRLLHHALDGVDGGLEVDDHALAQALALGLADADDVEAPLFGDLGDDRAHLVGAHVEADDVTFLLLGHLPPFLSGNGLAIGSMRGPRGTSCVSGRTVGTGEASPGARKPGLRRLLGVDAAA